MFSNQQNTNDTRKQIDQKAFLFGLISVFLSGVGFTIVSPVIPFLIQPYISNPAHQALVVTVLTSVYAICVFLAAPGLGALSDRFGRRFVLLICLLGSSIGYTVFGLGGALWILFLGRIIEGFTGGTIGTIFAYFSDITPTEERTKYFGWISAATGVGVVFGPTIGGLLAHFGYAIPMFAGAFVTFLNFLFGYFFMPESLAKENRLTTIPASRLNPFIQLKNILSIKQVSRLLFAGFLLWIPNGAFQAVFSQFTIDAFHWQPTVIGLVFSIIGIQDIFSQSVIMPRLLKWLTDHQIVILGMGAEIIGYLLIAGSAIFRQPSLFIVGMFLFGFGDSIFGPSFNGLLSKAVTQQEQGRVQGGSQAIQSLARVIGPLIGGQLYVSLGHSAPAIMGILLIFCAILVMYQTIQTVIVNH